MKKKKNLNTRLEVQIVIKRKKSFMLKKMVLHPAAFLPTFWESAVFRTGQFARLNRLKKKNLSK